MDPQALQKLFKLLFDGSHADSLSAIEAGFPAENVLAGFARDTAVQQASRQFLEQIEACWQEFNKQPRPDRLSEPAFAPDGSKDPAASAQIPTVSAPSPLPQGELDAKTLAGAERPGGIPVGRTPNPPMPGRLDFALGKNAKVGEPFDAVLEVAGGYEVEILDMDIPQESGLVYDFASRRLSGIPAAAGEYPLSFGYRLSARQEGGCLLIVNPDPRSLWKDLPSDRADIDWKPDEEARLIQGADACRIVAASQRGRSHAHVGGFREDDFFLDVGTGWNLLAVADGAGSAPCSRRGSQVAAQRAGEWMKQQLAGEAGQKLRESAAPTEDSPALRSALKAELYPILGGAAFEALKAIEEEAKAKGRAVKDYSTTLILGLHGKIPAGHLFATFWVGDGAAAVYRRGAGVELLGDVDSGEYAGQTRFLDRAVLSTGEEIMKRLRLTITQDFTAFALMSDGVSDPKFEADSNLEKPERWDALWNELSPLLATENPDSHLLTWLGFWSPGNHDDRTIALLYPE